MAAAKTGNPGATPPATLKVLAIFACAEKGAPMVEHDAVQVDDRGIVGDRYPDRGFFHQRRIPDQDRGITIISSRGIDAANAELQRTGIAPFACERTRRNLVIDIDVDALNSLLGRKFRIGDVEVEGTELCTPCKRPGELSGRDFRDQQAFVNAFAGRGGLRIRPLKGGQISKGSQLETCN